jgi:hypothetical protein
LQLQHGKQQNQECNNGCSGMYKSQPLGNDLLCISRAKSTKPPIAAITNNTTLKVGTEAFSLKNRNNNITKAVAAIPP